jgi:hypothetical protein
VKIPAAGSFARKPAFTQRGSVSYKINNIEQPFMPSLKRIVLDVLKPHHPNALDLATAIASLAPDYRVSLTITAVDEKTESAEVIIEGEALDFFAINGVIGTMGSTIHSIDVVEVAGSPADPS